MYKASAQVCVLLSFLVYMLSFLEPFKEYADILQITACVVVCCKAKKKKEKKKESKDGGKHASEWFFVWGGIYIFLYLGYMNYLTSSWLTKLEYFFIFFLSYLFFFFINEYKDFEEERVMYWRQERRYYGEYYPDLMDGPKAKNTRLIKTLHGLVLYLSVLYAFNLFMYKYIFKETAKVPSDSENLIRQIATFLCITVSISSQKQPTGNQKIKEKTDELEYALAQAYKFLMHNAAK